ncbi:MAG: glycosyl transferase family 1 [Oceanospirillaceae bacterium]|nr:glycosyl transferase family 1 [Oceanospirillaceae bacterium]MBS51299.1 glycosyl transferase family 1 [Oceanospirillaceae bacterium]|tara:strand:+ start:6070 stop:7167 length:1098 start_codon:yes stop_codon:yes gene_type:complete
MKNKTALLYDYLFSRGGAEKLSLTLAHGLRGCDLIVGMRDVKLFTDTDLKTLEGNVKVLTGYSDSKGWKTLKTMFTFVLNPPDMRGYDNAIYSGEYAPMALLRKKARAKRNFLYCHTIPRAPYDLYDFKLKQHKGIRRLAFRVVSLLIRLLYRPSLNHVDLIIANSENVRKRIKKYIGLDSVVINPPIDTERFKWIDQGDYYLSTARLEPAKRIATIVEAFKNMPDKKLVVASGGSDYDSMQELAKGYDNIRFTNWTTDEELFDLVGNCIATIYIPVDEDFGMSPLESMSAGKPCIGVAEGGLLETIVDGKTGWLMREATPAALVGQVVEATPELCITMKDNCIEHAQQYGDEVFIARLKEKLGY